MATRSMCQCWINSLLEDNYPEQHKSGNNEVMTINSTLCGLHIPIQIISYVFNEKEVGEARSLTQRYGGYLLQMMIQMNGEILTAACSCTTGVGPMASRKHICA